jgi:hypothetical protein
MGIQNSLPENVRKTMLVTKPTEKNIAIRRKSASFVITDLKIVRKSAVI